MGEIMGIGMFHGPHPSLTDETMANVYFRRNLQHPDLPPELADPGNWPAQMRAEWGDDEGLAAARRHRDQAIEGSRKARAAIDEFNPDVIVIFADDQYENFREDVLPPFCIYAMDEFSLVQSNGKRRGGGDGLGPRRLTREPLQETVPGSKQIGTMLADQLVINDYDVACSWKLHHLTGLGHAFRYTVDYLDWDRVGFDYPIVPFHVSCYGSDLRVPTPETDVAVGRLMSGVRVAPPMSPTPRRCYDIGRQVAEILAASPYRAVIMGSASWSHASLTDLHAHLWGDVESDRMRLQELKTNRFAAWRELSADQMRASGQHEMRNWISLAGAMEGRSATVLAYAETYIFNSPKCVAVFR
jgi:Catalytic LigB subunit of aromatic ring-opening dioxygenase